MVILFKPYHEPLIMAVPPKKWQTRRLWKKWRVKVGGLYWMSTSLFDKTKRFGRMKVLRRWEESLGSISDKDAIAEGYANPTAYFEAFARINRGKTALNTTVKCVEFEVAR